MTQWSREIKTAIERLANVNGTTAGCFLASVVKVNTEERTCVVKGIDATATTEYTDVMLQADTANGLLIEPAIDSTVLVAFNRRGYAFVAMFSEVQRVTIVAASGIQFNDGSFGGLVKVEELVSKLNRIENAFNSHTHTGVQTGSGSTGTPATQITPLTTKANIENTTVTHGQ